MNNDMYFCPSMCFAQTDEHFLTTKRRVVPDVSCHMSGLNRCYDVGRVLGACVLTNIVRPFLTCSVLAAGKPAV